MEEHAVTALQLAGDEVAGLGLWALVAQADPVVKGVLLLLVVASIWSWTVIFDKGFRLRQLRRKAQAFERAFWSGSPLDELYRHLGRSPDHPMAMLFASAMEEWRDTPRPSASSGRVLLERIEKVMMLTLDREVEQLSRHISSLATIGATAPFVGLFGTVWGIMNSFQSIALTKNTTLAVFAPGIAEALLATAIGLVAAIPAVIIYNHFARVTKGYLELVNRASGAAARLLSRDLDRTHVSGGQRGRGAAE
jgi:biopolymer transport protein TolQ